MIIRPALFLAFGIALVGCGQKETPQTAVPVRAEKGVSIENQSAAPEAPPTSPNPPPDQPAAAAPEPAADPDDATNPDNQKRYGRHVEWVRLLKTGDPDEKKKVAAQIKKAHLNEKERAQFEALKAHYNVDYPVEF